MSSFIDLGISVVLLLLGFGLSGWLLLRAFRLRPNLAAAFALSVAVLYQIVVVFALTGVALSRGSGAAALAVVCAALAIGSRRRPVAPVTAPPGGQAAPARRDRGKSRRGLAQYALPGALFGVPHHRERLARAPGSTAPTFYRVPE